MLLVLLGAWNMPVQAQTLAPGWNQLSTATNPGGRFLASQAYDAGHSDVVLFSGNDEPNDTWLWNGVNWSEVFPVTSPSARSNPAMAYDAAHGKVVLFGGTDNNSNSRLDDTWLWDGSNWTLASPVHSPPARNGSAMVYDEATGQIVLFGGIDGNGFNLNDTWTWNGNDWTQQTPLASPSPRSDFGLAYDAAQGQVVLFGGSASGTYESDTWLWNGSNWSQASVSAGPSARYASAMAYNAASGQVVLFGGYNGSYLGDTWTWNGSNWAQQTAASGPSARLAPNAMTYDAALGQVILYSGLASDTDTWAWGPAANFGNVNVCPSASTSPAPCSSSLALTYSISATTTLGAVHVVTQGAQGLDFTLAGGNTCTGTLSAGSFCTVNVNFAPLAPGLRQGAVNLLDGSNNVLATSLVYGVGQAPAIAFGPGTQTAVSTGSYVLSQPKGVAVDAVGDLFIADNGNQRVLKVTQAGVASTVGSGLIYPQGMAVDGAGDLFIADNDLNEVVEVTPAGIQSEMNYGLSSQLGVAVDGAGDLFIGDYNGEEVVEAPAGCGSSACTSVAYSSAAANLHPVGVAVDASGDLFVTTVSFPAGTVAGQVVKIPAGCTTSACQSQLGTGWSVPQSVAVDAAGDIFVADSGLEKVVEVPAGCTSSSCQIVVSSGIESFGITVDAASDVFIANSGGSQVAEVNRSKTPSLSFAATFAGTTSSDSPQSFTIQNVGNQTLDAVSPGLAVQAPNFLQVAGPGAPADCTNTFALAPGAACNASISFEPQMSGNPLTGTAVFTDNALNAAAARQTVALSGVGLQTSFTIGGSVSGLLGSGLVLQDNLGDNLAINSNGAFTFATPLSAGSRYSVTVLAQPLSPAQNCAVTNGSGAVVNANVSSVQVVCTTIPTYALTVTEAGTGTGTLTDNQGQINCSESNGSASGNCAATYLTGATVTLTASATGSSTFTGWGGSCASAGTSPTCTLTITSAVNPTAVFYQAPTAPSNPLSLNNNYFVTGDYYSAGVTLRGKASGTITLPSSPLGGTHGIPDGADILEAFLYWETIENTPTASGGSGTFNNYAITGQQIGNDLAYTDGVSGTLRVYRADVNAYLPDNGPNGVRLAAGSYTVSLPNSAGGNTGFPFTEGASLVVIYRVLSPNFPLKSVVIYDGSAIPAGAVTQAVQGFYDAVGGASGTGETTILSAGGGSWNNSLSSVTLGQPNQYTATLNPGNAYAAVILSTPVNNSDNDGILDAWKTGPGAGDFHAGQPGYYDLKTGTWVSLPGAQHGQKDLFVQLDYMCGAVLANGSCDPTQENLYPSPDASGNDPIAMVKQAFANTCIALHLVVGNAIPETTCTDSGSQLCEFPNQPGVVNWKDSLEFDKLWPRNLASCVGGGDCTARFPYGQKDSYHYVLFGHSLALPAWNSRYGTLVSIQVANGVTTIVTADRGSGINACPSRITLSGVIGNPSLNGTYNTSSCADTKTITVPTPGVPNWSYPNNTLPEPIIGLTSGTITSISGYSDLGGQDSAVTLGLWLTAPNQDMSKRANVTAGTLFHEIGHTLGLTHGGLYYQTPNSYIPTFDVNCKPNYQSVMNYLFQLDLVGPNASVAFSNQTLATLNESSLASVTQLTDGSGNPATFSTSAWYVPWTTTSPSSPATLHCDGTPLNDDQAYRVNGPVAPITPPWTNGQNIGFDGVPYTQMLGYNDQANIDLRQVGATGGEYASLSALLNFGSSSAPLNIASGGNVSLGSGGTVTLGSGGTVTLGSGGNVTLGSGGTVTLGSGGNITLGSGGTVTLGSGGTVTPGSNGTVTLGSGGTIALGSGGTVTLGSGGTITLGSGGNVTLGSGGTIALGSGGSVTVSPGGSYDINSSGGTITLGSGGNVTLGSGGNVTLGSGGTIALGSGGTVTLGSGGNVTLGSGGTIALGSGGTVTLGSGGNVTLGSGGTIALGSGGTVTLGSGGNVTLGSGGTVTLGSGGNVTLGSGGNVTLGSGGSATLGAGGTVTLGSGGNVTLGSGGNVTLGSGGTITLGSGGTVTLGSGGTVTLGSGGTVTLGSGGAPITVGSGGTVTLGSGGTVTLGSGGNVTLGSGGNVTLGSGGTIALGSGGTVTLGSGGTVTLGSGGNVTLGSGGVVALGSGGNVTLGSGGTIVLGSGGNVTLGSGGNVTLGSGGADTNELTYETANSFVRPPSLPTETPITAGVLVSWSAPIFGVVQTYTIYRSSNGATPILIGSVSGINGNAPATKFLDTNPDTTSQSVVYTITTTLLPVVIDPTTRQSPPSPPAVLLNQQSITLGPLPSSVLLTAPQPTVTATAVTNGVANGLQVNFSAAGYCSIGSQSIANGVSSATIVLNNTGNCTITASQSGSSAYLAANSVSASFTILPAGSTTESQTISFAALPSVQYGSKFTLSATSSSGLPITYTASGPCTTSGTTTGTTTGIGECSITANAPSNATYSAASLTQSFTVFPAVLTVTAANLTSVFGQSPPALTATIAGYVNGDPTSVVTGAPALSTTATSTSSVGVYPITVLTGTLAAANYSFRFVNGSLTINIANQSALSVSAASPLTYGQSETLSTLGGSTGGSVSYSVSGGACTITGSALNQLTANSGTGSCSVTATMAGNRNYNSVTSSPAIVALNPAAQTITFNTIAAQTVGAPLTLGATASSGLAVTYSASPGTVCMVSGSTATFIASGICNITASQTGSANYSAASQRTQSFTVNPAPSFSLSLATPSVTIPSGGVGATDAITIVDAGGFTGSVALSAALPALSSSEFTDAFLPASSTTASTFVIVAQPGVVPGQYTIPIKGVSGSLSVTTNLTVNVTGTQTITFNSIATQFVGTPLPLTAAASSGLAVTYSASPASVCTVSGTTATFVGAGTCTITAAQAGNTYYSAATSVSQSFPVNVPPSFTLSLASTSVTIPAVSLGTTDLVTVVDAGGFGGFVALSAAPPASGFTVLFLPSITPTISILDILPQPGLVPGRYIIPITGVSGSLSATTNLTVNVTGTQSITFNSIATQTVGTPLALTATASSGLAVSYSASPASVCTVSGTTATFVGAGTCTITASQAGNAYYSAATSVSQSFIVSGIPSFTLTAATGTLSQVPGASIGVTDAITVNPINGFTGTVAFAASGVPAGVSYTFLPATSTTGATLVMYVPAGVPASSNNKIVITGTSGATAAQTTVTLNIP